MSSLSNCNPNFIFRLRVNIVSNITLLFFKFDSPAVQLFKVLANIVLIQMKAQLIIKSAKNLPKIGLSTLPSPYLVIRSDQNEYLTQARNNTCNPLWSFPMQVKASNPLELLYFFIYNQNQSRKDELIAIGSIEFQQLLTFSLTSSKIPLTDSEGNIISSWLQIQHNTCNPPSNLINHQNEQTTITVNLLSITSRKDKDMRWLSLFKKKKCYLKYGSQTKNIIEGLPVTLRYDSSQTVIKIMLKLGENENELKLEGQVAFDNIGQSNSFRVRMYHGSIQITALLVINVIEKGIISDSSNTLIFEILDLMIEPIKKVPKEWSIAIYSVFSHSVISKLNQPIRLYIQNNISLELEYFQQIQTCQTVTKHEPIGSISIPINSINWSAQDEAIQDIKMYNQSRGLIINCKVKFTTLNNNNSKGLSVMPKFEKPNWTSINQKETFKISQIQMSGACFSEIFTEKTMFFFVFIPNFSPNCIVFPSFPIKNSIDYNITCRHSVVEPSRGGTFLLLTFDHFFGKEGSSEDELQNYIVFRMSCKNLYDLSEVPIVFHDRFLAFAKKQTLVKVCKKFDLMIKDRTISVKLVGKMFPIFQPGYLHIQNCRAEGDIDSLKVTVISDSNEISFNGEWNKYLLSKPYTLMLKDNGIQIKLAFEEFKKQFHYEYQEIFGNPEPNNLYKLTIPIYGDAKLYIFYRFQRLKAKQNIKEKQRNFELTSRFNSKSTVNIKLKNVHLSHSNYSSFYLRVNRGSSVFETLQENPSLPFIRFRDCEQINLISQQDNPYIFFNLYCKNKENSLTIFTGHYNVKNLLGKGVYQVNLNEMGKDVSSLCIVTFQLLNNLGFSAASSLINVKSIRSTCQQYLKTFMKYYLVCQANNNPFLIIEPSKVSDSLLFNCNLSIRNSQNIVLKLFWSSKQLSKEGFWSSQEKQMIGIGCLKWADIQSSGICELKFIPYRQLSLKMSSNYLSLLQNEVKLLLDFKADPQTQTEILIMKKQLKPVDVDVLSGGAAKITITEILPYNNYEKTLSIALNPFNYQFSHQSRTTLNKQFYVELQNMVMKIVGTKTSKLNEKFVKIFKQKEINFRGKKIKTGERYGFTIDLPMICVIKAEAIILNTKFTNNSRGKLNIQSFSSDSSKLKEIQIIPLQNPTLLSSTLPNGSKFQINNKIGTINRSYDTETVQFCLYFILTFEDKQKSKVLLPLAEVQIDKMDDKPFKHQWKFQSKQRQISILSIIANYEPSKVKQAAGTIAQYWIHKQNIVEQLNVQPKKQQIISLIEKANKSSSFRPGRKRGYRAVVNVPGDLSAESIELQLQDGNKVILQSLVFNSSNFYQISEKPFRTKSIKIKSQKVERVQELEEKNFARRFLVNRNPNFIIKLLQQPYAIADSKLQSIVLIFHFHSIFSIDSKQKIAWMKSNKHDDVLTKQFGLLIKHGKQKKIIRPISQNGYLKQKISEENEMNYCASFGFDPISDEVQIFLYIHHILNENNEAQDLYQQDIRNWTKMFPIAHGKIYLQKANDQTLVGCQLKKIQNNSLTITKPLNNAIVISKLNCLGSIQMQKRRWGCIQIVMQEVSSIELEGFSLQNSLICFNLEVENNHRKKYAECNTEARKFVSIQKIRFINNSFKFMYFEQMDESENLKVSANFIYLSNNYKLFEKRADLSEYLRQPGRHPFTIQIKPSECKDVKNVIQIKFVLINSSQWQMKQAIDLKEKFRSRQISVLVSDKNTSSKIESYNETEIILYQMLKCQRPSDLQQLITDFKQQILYEYKHGRKILQLLAAYLQMAYDRKIISSVLQAISIILFKQSKLIQSFNQEDILTIYQHFQILGCTNIQQLKNAQSKGDRVTKSKYLEQIRQIQFQKLTFSKMNQMASKQYQLFYSSEQKEGSYSFGNKELLIENLNVFVEQSQLFKQKFQKNVFIWVQNTLVDKGAAMKLLQIIVDIGQGFPPNSLQQVTALILSADSIPLKLTIVIWSKLNKQSIRKHAQRILEMAIKQSCQKTSTPENVQNLKTVINYIQLHSLQVKSEQWRATQNCCMASIQKSEDFIMVNIYGEILIKLNSIGKLQKNEIMEIGKRIDAKLSLTGNKNIKLSLSNIKTKLCGVKFDNTKNQGKEKKSHLYNKYLISS